MAVLHPLECYLLEHFTSTDYIRKTRDAVIQVIDAHEAAFARLQGELDPCTRNLPLWQQGDVVWGTRVLPNIRPGRDLYNEAYVDRNQGGSECFGKVGSLVAGWTRGICEFWDGWMTEEERINVDKATSVAREMDRVLGNCVRGKWREGSLTYRCRGVLSGGLVLPAAIPRYEIDPSVQIERYSEVSKMGVYLPDVDFAPARFLYPNESNRSVEALQGVSRIEYNSEITNKRYYDWKECRRVQATWTLVRQVKDEFIQVPPEGFFPQGVPGELYDWPSRESYYVERRNRRPIFLMPGQPISGEQ
jgi:hypothetical protein